MLNIFRSEKNSAQIDHGAVFCAPEHIVVHLHKEGVVLLDSRKGLLFSGNRAAATIWAGISQKHAIETIVDQLSSDNGVPAARVLEDTMTYIRNLQQRGLVARMRS